MTQAADWRDKLADPVEVVGQVLAQAFALPPTLTVSEWADTTRIVAEGTSANPGPWSTDVVPYLRGIMDALSPSDPVKDVVFMKSAQVAGTECLNNWLGFIVDHAPDAVLVVHPTIDAATAWHREKLAPMIEATPPLLKKLGAQVERKAGTTSRFRKFAGGFIKIAGANASAGLRSSSIRFAGGDEIDDYPFDLGGQGDPIAMIRARQKAYQHNRKSFWLSTPTLAETSRIVAMYEASDKRRFYVPCPHCGKKQVLRWDGIKYEKEAPHDPHYQCVACGVLIEEAHKPAMLAGGEWIAEAPGIGKAAGFHINALYSPFEPWDGIVAEWLASQGRPEKLKAFVNLYLGEPWVDKSNSVKAEALHERREDYQQGVAPSGVLFLTCGVDVQDDRLEYEVVGWGAGMSSWSIEYDLIVGDTSQPGPWIELAKLVERQFSAEDGGDPFVIACGGIDSGGHRTQQVYQFTRTRERWLALKGQAGFNRPYVERPSYQDISWKGRKIKRGAVLWNIGKYEIQRMLNDQLRLDPEREADEIVGYPQGYCHFPSYDLTHFQELTSERLVELTDRQGRRKLQYVHDRQFRNEPLDCRIYAMAAALSPFVSMHRYSPAKWKELAEGRGVNIDDVMSPLEQLWNETAQPASSSMTAKDRAARFAEMRRQRQGV